MSYVESSLMPGEQVKFRTTLHWMMFVGPVITLLFGAWLAYIAPNPVFGVFIVVCALALGLARFIDYKTSEFAVTDKRVIIKVGFLRRRTLELQLTKVETVAVNQGIAGRIFRYGNIVVTGTGGTKEPFKGIEAPLEFRHAVQVQTSQ